MPDVVGLPLPQAKERIAQADLAHSLAGLDECRVGREPGLLVGEPVVESQSPSAGIEVALASKVVLTTRCQLLDDMRVIPIEPYISNLGPDTTSP